MTPTKRGASLRVWEQSGQVVALTNCRFWEKADLLPSALRRTHSSFGAPGSFPAPPHSGGPLLLGHARKVVSVALSLRSLRRGTPLIVLRPLDYVGLRLRPPFYWESNG